jgi:predicted branched-subunit amino acid permease
MKGIKLLLSMIIGLLVMIISCGVSKEIAFMQWLTTFVVSLMIYSISVSLDSK